MSEQMKAATSEAQVHDQHLSAIEHGHTDPIAGQPTKKRILVEEDEEEGTKTP